MAPRENFVEAAQVEQALRDIALPLPCGQTVERPSELALALAALSVRAAHARPGDGNGIGLVGGGAVRSRARGGEPRVLRSLARSARERLERLKIGNVAVIWADGNEVSPALGLFDRIIVHGAFEAPPRRLLGALGEGGALIGAVGEHEKTRRLLYRRLPGDRIVTEPLGPCRAQALLRGLFGAL